MKIIHGTKPQIESTVKHATLIRSKRSAYGNGNVRTQSIFLIRTTFSPYEKSRSLALRTNEIPLYKHLGAVKNIQQYFLEELVYSIFRRGVCILCSTDVLVYLILLQNACIFYMFPPPPPPAGIPEVLVFLYMSLEVLLYPIWWRKTHSLYILYDPEVLVSLICGKSACNLICPRAACIFFMSPTCLYFLYLFAVLVFSSYTCIFYIYLRYLYFLYVPEVLVFSLCPWGTWIFFIIPRCLYFLYIPRCLYFLYIPRCLYFLYVPVVLVFCLCRRGTCIFFIFLGCLYIFSLNPRGACICFICPRCLSFLYVPGVFVFSVCLRGACSFFMSPRCFYFPYVPGLLLFSIGPRSGFFSLCFQGACVFYMAPRYLIFDMFL